MYKFLVKLAILVLGIYLLSQIPFFQSYSKAIVDSFNQKVGNVTKEVDRIKGKVDETKEKIDDTKQAVDEFTGKVIDTKESVEEGFTTAKKAIDSVSDALTSEGAPAPTTATTEKAPVAK